jgi:hypothetical protein
MDRRVTTRQINSGEERRRAAEKRAAFRRPVSGRRIIERRNGPAQLDADDVVAVRDRRRPRRRVMRRLVKNRAVEPHDLPVIGVVVLDLCHLVVMDVDLVGREVAVRDGVAVIVTCLVEVLRRQR